MIVLVSSNTGVLQNSSRYQLGTIDDVVNYCKDKSVLGVDTETEGFDFTFLTELIISCGKSLGYGLKDLCKRYLNVELNKDVRNQFIGLVGQPYREDQIVYGARDVEYLCKIRELQLPKIVKNKLENVVKLENQAVLALADIEYNGLNIDVLKWKALESINNDEAEKLGEELDLMVKNDKRLKRFISTHIQTDMFTPVEELRDINIKWTSPKQVLDVFQCIVPKLDNVNGKQMYKYRYKFPLIDKYVKYKEAIIFSTG